MGPTDQMEETSEERQLWVWIGIAAGLTLGAAATVYLLRHNDAAHRMDRLLRRCEGRIHNIESSLSDLESSLTSPQA